VLSRIEDDRLVLSPAGAIVDRCRRALPDRVRQSRFYERVIRHRDELDQTRIYIVQNPLRWLGRKVRWP
jgi:hypothetical protein